MGLTEVTGVIAVIVSVLYLGLQIRDNTKVLRSQAHYNALSLAQRPMEMMIENECLAGVVNRSYADPSAVSADDWARFGNYAFIGFNAWEYLYYQHRDKAYCLVASQVPVRGMFWLQETADHVPDIELPSRVPMKDTGTPERTQPMVTLDPSSVRSTVPVGQSVFVLSIGPL